MSMQDPIADMLTRIRNAQRVGKPKVTFAKSKIKQAIVQVLKEEGYLSDFEVTQTDKPEIIVTLKYYQGQPVISRLTRVSRPGLRIYKPSTDLPRVSGFGIAIISTSRGIMTNKLARRQKIGGEIICEVA
ncbi:MAG: 30S ribosomal protein S8 [Legionellales bacterium]|nr:30S ribosomal protein S8 [Legionellales bacterium]